MVEEQKQPGQSPSQLVLSGKVDENDLSFDRVMGNPVTAKFEKPATLASLIKRAASSITDEFHELNRSRRKPMFTEFQHMDIYCDIHPFKETAIILNSDSQQADAQYINANRIRSIYGEPLAENLTIAAQGPIDTSLPNFWKMVHQERVGMVVTLVHQIPGDCDLYFPTQGKATYDDMEVTLVGEAQESQFIMRRDFKVTDTSLAAVAPQTLSHYHFQGWEDWQLPTGDSRAELVTLTERAADYVTANAAKQGENRERLLVHCRAGIGRTGTTLTIINAIIAIKEQVKRQEPPTLSLFSIVRRLREHRIWMVQTEDQYEYVYEFFKTTQSKWLNRQ